MIYLVAKILVLLLLAALLGAWLARWWVSRHYEDVTSEYAALGRDWQAWRKAWELKLAERPAVDLSSLTRRFDTLEAAVHGIVIPPTPAVDLAPLHARLAAVENAIREIVVPPAVNVDLSPIMLKLDALESQSVPRTAPPAAVSGDAGGRDAAGPLIREGSRNLLAHAAFGKPDDLKLITGVKTVMEKMLHQIGVYYFWQIAEWTPADIAHADAQLTAFHGRIERDSWVEQATAFASHPSSASKPESVG